MRILFLLLLITSHAHGHDDGLDWLKESGGMPPTITQPSIDIPVEDIYPVVPTKEFTALYRDLSDKDIVPISTDLAEWFTGHYYFCTKGKTPFLVRAVFGNGGTGGFDIRRIGNNLSIHHGSLGTSFHATKTALVVNLDFSPEKLLLSVSIDE